MGAEDIGKKIEEVKTKIDSVLDKTDIDEKIKANAGDIRRVQAQFLTRQISMIRFLTRLRKLLESSRMARKTTLNL